MVNYSISWERFITWKMSEPEEVFTIVHVILMLSSSKPNIGLDSVPLPTSYMLNC